MLKLQSDFPGIFFLLFILVSVCSVTYDSDKNQHDPSLGHQVSKTETRARGMQGNRLALLLWKIKIVKLGYDNYFHKFKVSCDFLAFCFLY